MALAKSVLTESGGGPVARRVYIVIYIKSYIINLMTAMTVKYINPYDTLGQESGTEPYIQAELAVTHYRASLPLFVSSAALAFLKPNRETKPREWGSGRNSDSYRRAGFTSPATYYHALIDAEVRRQTNGKHFIARVEESELGAFHESTLLARRQLVLVRGDTDNLNPPSSYAALALATPAHITHDQEFMWLPRKQA